MSEIPSTKLLAAFVANASVNQLTPTLREKIKEVLVDYIGVALGALEHAESSEPIYKAIVALQGPGASGNCTVLGKGKPHMLPQYAGLLNSTFAHSLDFDDTFAAGILHAGVTAVSAALTQAEILGDAATAEEFMLAISVGYEVACRLGVQLGIEGHERGMHNTSTAGIFGAVASIAVLKHLSTHTVEMAFGLAGSQAAGSMQYLDNGSWNKRLNPGFAVHDAFMCVALAEAGVVGATKIFEGKMGFLRAYSAKKERNIALLTEGLGHHWIWLASSLKPWSACRMVHVFIEMAGEIFVAHGGKVPAEEIRSIRVEMPSTCLRVVGEAVSNKVHPLNAIDAQFSVYFQIAQGLTFGPTGGLEVYRQLEDSNTHKLCDLIAVDVDESFIPFGGRIIVEWANGEKEEKSLMYPLGEEQHPLKRADVESKFMSLARPVVGKDKANRVVKLVEEMESHRVEELLELVR